MTGRRVLAVDGGNSKTDLALLREDGALLAHVRGGLSSPHHLGLDGSVELLQGLYDAAVAQAGLRADGRPVAEVGRLLLAGLDFPAEERRLHDAVAPLGWARSIAVGNDTFAVLRAGTERGWGVAVVCGAGINCVGVGPDGRHVRFFTTDGNPITRDRLHFTQYGARFVAQRLRAAGSPALALIERAGGTGSKRVEALP